MDNELVTSESDVGAVNEAVTLDDVVRGEVWDFAVVDSCLVRSQEEVVSQVEQMVRC